MKQAQMGNMYFIYKRGNYKYRSLENIYFEIYVSDYTRGSQPGEREGFFRGNPAGFRTNSISIVWIVDNHKSKL